MGETWPKGLLWAFWQTDEDSEAFILCPQDMLQCFPQWHHSFLPQYKFRLCKYQKFPFGSEKCFLQNDENLNPSSTPQAPPHQPGRFFSTHFFKNDHILCLMGRFCKEVYKMRKLLDVWHEAAFNTSFFQLTEACQGIATGWQPFHPCAPNAVPSTPHVKVQKPFRTKKFKNTRMKSSYYSLRSITIWFQPLAISKQRTI